MCCSILPWTTDPSTLIKMDIKTCLQHLAKSLELIGLNISPTTWNISDNGSQLCMNIVFDHRPSYQGLQLRNFDDQSEKTFQKKSHSTLKRDRARMDYYLKKLEKKMSITPENAPHQINDNRLNFNVDAPDFIPMSSNIIKKSELVDNCDNIFLSLPVMITNFWSWWTKLPQWK